jgi:hypothetical protein
LVTLYRWQAAVKKFQAMVLNLTALQRGMEVFKELVYNAQNNVQNNFGPSFRHSLPSLGSRTPVMNRKTSMFQKVLSSLNMFVRVTGIVLQF